MASDPPVSRRTVVVGAIVTLGAGVAGYVVASNSSVAKAKTITTAANNYGYQAPAKRKRIAALSEVPVGGALIVKNARVVLVRDAAGVHAFSATCTHQGCTVTDVRNGQIICPCHGSSFALSSGAVTGGPAPRPLPSVPVVVEGDTVFSSGEGA
jgi:Rieske Fe-S protein